MWAGARNADGRCAAGDGEGFVLVVRDQYRGGAEFMQDFAHLQRQPQSFFFRWRTGDLMSRCVNDLTSVRLMLGPGLLSGCLIVLAGRPEPYAQDVYVGNSTPTDRRDRMVTFRRDGGPRLDVVRYSTTVAMNRLIERRIHHMLGTRFQDGTCCGA